MRIQHNIMAMNSYRNYSQNTSALSKNLEKLSSGYKINRAGDDAAGLAISEKMRAQVTGLKAAQKNAKDGISLVQTAEGALTEVHSMLNRMVDLADQSANGTYDNETDRANLQKEVEALKSEIDRIADSTNFNGIKLLDGTMGSSSSASSTIKVGSIIAAAPNAAVTENAAKNISYKSNNAMTAMDTVGTDALAGKLTFTVKDEKGVSSTIEVATSALAGNAANTAATSAESIVNDLKANSKFSALFDVSSDATGNLTFTAKGGSTITNIAADTEAAKLTGAAAVATTTSPAAAANTTLATGGTIAAGDKISVNGKLYEFVAAGGSASKGATAVEVGADADASMANLKTELEKNGYTVEEDAGTANTWIFSKMGDTVGGTGSLTLQIGDTADSFNQLTVSVGDMHTSSLGISDLDISTQAGAKAAVDAIKAAINSVSSTRGDLGATQNRLEHTINNLSVMTENIQDAEANIRDVDVAEEMMAYTKNNILVQSAQAMLAQANQIPQGVLQLLQ